MNLVNGPGFEFIGDKLFYTFIDKLIQFYLKEEPIIRYKRNKRKRNKAGKLKGGKVNTREKKREKKERNLLDTFIAKLIQFYLSEEPIIR